MSARRWPGRPKETISDDKIILEALLTEAESRNPDFRSQQSKAVKDAMARRDKKQGK